jgi:three-Cys-motif partner protein
MRLRPDIRSVPLSAGTIMAAKRKKNDRTEGSRSAKRMLLRSEQLSFAEVSTWEIPKIAQNAVEVDALPCPIWTETKAQLIANYLRLFLMITRHGAYIDGFAGPQDRANPASWAAKLVIEMSPRWMNRFLLCEKEKTPYLDLLAMLQMQPKTKNRAIHHKHADFNRWVSEALALGAITDKTATFALLDQRSTECNWETVKTLAAHKRGSTKIELFYFFPTGWVHRTIKETDDKSALDAWWGDEGWRQVESVSQDQANTIFVRKIQALGYRDVKSWPICQREYGAGRTMYHMIHATDHLEAPKLMYRAYRDLIGSAPGGDQQELPLPAPTTADHK